MAAAAAGDDETDWSAVAAGVMGMADPAAAWMELACCVGSGGTGEAGAHSGLSMPESESELESGELLPLATAATVALAAAELPLPHLISPTSSTESLFLDTVEEEDRECFRLLSS